MLHTVTIHTKGGAKIVKHIDAPTYGEASKKAKQQIRREAVSHFDLPRLELINGKPKQI
jgi:hypothetical protein